MRILFVERERHDERRSARRKIRGCDLSAMCSRDFAAEAQAQPTAFAGRPCATKKSIENMRQLGWMDSLAGVRDPDNRPIRVALQADINRSAYRCELQRVVEQIHNQTAQMPLVTVD